MGIYNIVEKLQEIQYGKIIIFKIGGFYTSIGKDAVILNREIDLKVSCMKKGICKVGFPINSLEKYLELIRNKDYGYVVYEFNELKTSIEEIAKFEGRKISVGSNRKNCIECKGINVYTEDKYLIALEKYINR